MDAMKIEFENGSKVEIIQSNETKRPSNIYFYELPEECQECENLRCYSVHMNGKGSYTCTKVPVFWKNKEEKCENRIGI